MKYVFIAFFLLVLGGGAFAEDGRTILERHFEWMATATYRRVDSSGSGKNAISQETIQMQLPDGTVLRKTWPLVKKTPFYEHSTYFHPDGITLVCSCKNGTAFGFRFSGDIPRMQPASTDEVTAVPVEHKGVACWKITWKTKTFVEERIVGQVKMMEYSFRRFSSGGALQGTSELESVDFEPELDETDFQLPARVKVKRVADGKTAYNELAKATITCAEDITAKRRGGVSQSQRSRVDRFKAWLARNCMTLLAALGVVFLGAGVAVRLYQKRQG